MPIQLDGAQFLQQPGPVRPDSTQSPAGLPGKLNGEAFIATSSANSQIADMAEEMSFVANQFKHKTSDKRKLKSGTQLSDQIRKRIQKIQTIQGTQSVKDLLNEFQTRQRLSNQQIRDRLEQFSGDVVDQYAVLDSAVEHFETIGDTEKSKQFATIRDQLMRENEVLIKAGLNISERAAEFGDMGSVRALRESYADHVQDHKSLNDAYSKLVKEHGAENLEVAIYMQLQLLATDLHCVDPSAPERLDAVIKDLGKLKVLVGVHDSCCETEEQLKRTYPDTRVEPNVLMKKLLNVVDQQWMTEADFDRIPIAMNVYELEPGIFTLTKVIDIVRMIPEEVFNNEETKQAILATAQEGLDGKVEEEAAQEMESLPDSEGIVGEVVMDLIGSNKGQAGDSIIPLGLESVRGLDDSEE